MQWVCLLLVSIVFHFMPTQIYWLPLGITRTHKIVGTQIGQHMRKESSTNFLNEKDLTEHCGMFFTLKVIGGRWKVSILAALLDEEELRYAEIKNRLPGITERMLIKQLKELQDDEIITRIELSKKPLKVAYRLTNLGESLRSVMEHMLQWGKENKPRE